MKKTVIIATNQLDSQGDIINLSGLKLPKDVIVTHNFDRTKPVGFADNIHVDGNQLKADIEITKDIETKYPAIGFSIIKCRQEKDIRYIDEFVLYELSLCTQPNADPNVPPIE